MAKPLEDELKSLFGQVHDAAQRAVSKVNELNSQINTLLGQRESLEKMILTKVDYMAIVRHRIHETGKIHADLLSRHEVRKLDRTITANERASLGIDTFCAGIGHGPISPAALCYFFEDLIVAGIDKAVDTLEWPEPGAVPSEAEIKTQIESIDAQVDALLLERDGYTAVLNSYQVVHQEGADT